MFRFHLAKISVQEEPWLSRSCWQSWAWGRRVAALTVLVRGHFLEMVTLSRCDLEAGSQVGFWGKWDSLRNTDEWGH